MWESSVQMSVCECISRNTPQQTHLMLHCYHWFMFCDFSQFVTVLEAKNEVWPRQQSLNATDAGDPEEGSIIGRGGIPKQGLCWLRCQPSSDIYTDHRVNGSWHKNGHRRSSTISTSSENRLVCGYSAIFHQKILKLLVSPFWDSTFLKNRRHLQVCKHSHVLLSLIKCHAPWFYLL